MTTPISALEHQPSDFIREASLDAINFYVDKLSGIYLPDDFKQAHGDVYHIKYWKPENRLRGKFGRFALKHVQEEDDQAEIDDILLMGTTIGLSGLGRDGYMESLRHYSLQDKVREVLEERELVGAPIRIDRADYGDTTIVLGENGDVNAFSAGGSSYDFGRANAEGRQQTCDVFERLLGNAIKVINADPEPKPRDRIVN
jgi:hypothetical protein